MGNVGGSEGGARAWRGKGAGRGSGGAGGRPGDWTCRECRAYPCFARAAFCYRCKAPRSGGGGGAGRPAAATSGISRPSDAGGYLGPIGANGSRPMLGRRDEGAAPHGAGAKLGTDAGHGRSAAREQDDDKTTGTKVHATKVDEEGFREVPGRGGASYAEVAAAAAARADSGTRGRPIEDKNSWAALTEEEDDEDACDMEEENIGEGPGAEETRADGAGGGRERQGEDKAAGDEDEQALRGKWMALCNVVRKLDHDRTVPTELLAEARNQRDAAERRWRAAKQPHPLSKRLRWAEAELRDAESREEAHRSELADHLAQAARRTTELEKRIAVDSARTARKREALKRLYREGGVPSCQGAEKAARIAVAGIRDLAPSITAVINHMGGAEAPVEEMRKELQAVAAMLGHVESVLQEATKEAMDQRGPAQFDISSGTAGSSDGRGGYEGCGDDDGTEGGGGGKTTQSAQAQRWVKPNASAPWKRLAVTAADAVERARQVLRRREEEAMAEGAGDSTGIAEEARVTVGSGATTNDLAEAERRERARAEQQIQLAMQQQQHQPSPQQMQQEEQARMQREQRQREEMAKHQEAMQRAATERAIQEAREREELIAKMSPAELARAAEVHAQQAAVAAHTFGTAAANHMAGLVHQAHAHQVAQATVGADMETEEVNRLMAMSPEELAQHDREMQGRGGYW